jgi:hypothetical protein
MTYINKITLSGNIIILILITIDKYHLTYIINTMPINVIYTIIINIA